MYRLASLARCRAFRRDFLYIVVAVHSMLAFVAAAQCVIKRNVTVSGSQLNKYCLTTTRPDKIILIRRF